LNLYNVQKNEAEGNLTYTGAAVLSNRKARKYKPFSISSSEAYLQI